MTYIELIITAIFNGFGVAIGSYVANKSLINKLEKKYNNVKPNQHNIQNKGKNKAEN
jgi:hypothetical protein